MKKILIDTDVILDFFFDRRPFSEYATIILSRCEKKVLEGFITPVIISNVYCMLRQTAKHEKVIEKLRKLSGIIDILPMDSQTVRQALDSDFKDFEDALQNYAALNSGGIDVIITRNVKDYKAGKISVMTPESFVKLRI